jgi:hypothetical protein
MLFSGLQSVNEGSRVVSPFSFLTRAAKALSCRRNLVRFCFNEMLDWFRTFKKFSNEYLSGKQARRLKFRGL